LLALSHSGDQYHARAIAMTRSHRASGATYIGTTLILSEFHSHLLYLRGSSLARIALEHLMSDPIHEWLAVDVDVVQAAANNWVSRFADQSFSLVDAVSFEVMRRNRVESAFAFDHRFEVAGFELLS
jgi:predicted nucleic acid-binding protein